MKSKLTIVATIFCIACAAFFMWYVSREPAQPALKPRPVAPEPKPVPPPVKEDLPAPTPESVAPPPAAPLETPAATDMACVTGIVVSADDAKPIQDALITIGDAILTKTGYDGRFAIDNLPVTVTMFKAVHAGYLEGTASFHLEVGTPVEVRIELKGCGGIEGVVLRNGRPSPGEQIQIGQKETKVETDAKGHYQSLDETPGEVTVIVVTDPGASYRVPPKWARATATIEQGKTTVVDFDMPLMQSQVEGAVLIEGRPPDQASVHARIACSYGNYSASSEVTPEGRYSFAALPAGSISLSVNATDVNGFVRRRLVELEVPEARALQYDFIFTAGCAVSGTVTGAAQDERVSVLIMKGNLPSGRELSFQEMLNLGQGIVGNANPQADGTFRIDGIDPGPHTAIAMAITAHTPGQDAASTPVRSVSMPVTLTEGKEASVNLSFR